MQSQPNSGTPQAATVPNAGGFRPKATKGGRNTVGSTPRHPIGLRIHQRLAVLGKSRRWLAGALGVPKSTLSNWLAGDQSTRVPAIAIVPLALTLDVNPLWLLCLVKDPSPDRLSIRKEVATLRHNLELTKECYENIDGFAKSVIEWGHVVLGSREKLSESHLQVDRMMAVASRTSATVEGDRLAPIGGGA